jgi:hypothetical protein
MELARLKRRYLAEGFTEADIHKVIPDRPRAKPAKAADPAKKQPVAPEAVKPESDRAAPDEPT